MRSQSSLSRNAALGAAVALALAAGQAAGQQSGSQAVPVELEEIIVTGSQITLPPEYLE